MAVARYAVLLGLVGCGDNLDQTEPPEPGTIVEVPTGMTDPPFDQPRTLLLPPGFGIRVIARVPTARFLAETPEGDLLVSQPDDIALANGQVFKVTNPRGNSSVASIASGLTLPHDMVFTERSGVEYLYLSEHYRVSRVAWDPTAATLGTLTTIADDFPSVVSNPELMGHYGHALKNIAISGEDLYISVSSATNSDPADLTEDPTWPRGAIYRYPVDGGTGRIFAKGIRNAEGLAFHPKTGELWAAVNHRDGVRYPFHDGKFPYDSDAPDYVNDHPAEPFTRVRDGGNYGWPYCNPNPDNGFSDMPYVPDIDNNLGETVLNCEQIDVIDKGLPAHSAPLGMSFWTGDNVPAGYHNGAVMGLHGCWDCTVVHGYKVVFMAMRDDNGFEDATDLVTGFFRPDGDPMVQDEAWGRPVDVIPNRAGNLYISDDRAGAVYELYRK